MSGVFELTLRALSADESAPRSTWRLLPQHGPVRPVVRQLHTLTAVRAPGGGVQLVVIGGDHVDGLPNQMLDMCAAERLGVYVYSVRLGTWRRLAEHDRGGLSGAISVIGDRGPEDPWLALRALQRMPPISGHVAFALPHATRANERSTWRRQRDAFDLFTLWCKQTWPARPAENPRLGPAQRAL